MITREFSPSTNRRIGQGLLFVAVLFALIACWRWHLESQFLDAARIASGQVMTITDDGESAEVVFRDANGRTHTITPWARSPFRTYDVGERIEVLVFHQDPLEAKFNESMQIWATTHVFLCLSAMTGVFGTLIFRGIVVVGPLKQTSISVGL